MRELTAFQQDLLVVLARFENTPQPPSGADVGRELKLRWGSLNPDRLYRNLDALCDKDLVVKDQLDGRTKTYQLTEDGHCEYEEIVSWTTNQNNWQTPTKTNELNP